LEHTGAGAAAATMTGGIQESFLIVGMLNNKVTVLLTAINEHIAPASPSGILQLGQSTGKLLYGQCCLVITALQGLIILGDCEACSTSRKLVGLGVAIGCMSNLETE